jgi:4-hydroxybenzoate polyprenyltransferase
MQNNTLITLKAFLKLIRWFHELLAILPFLGLYLIIEYYALKSGRNCNLSGYHFAILCLCVQLLIAAGCVLNDIMDHAIDRINKPKTHVVGNTISLSTARKIFIVLTILIVTLSFYISKYMFVEWSYISLSVYVCSIFYNVYFKRSPLLGNILMALLTSFIPLVLFIFAKDCIEVLNNEKVNLLIYLYAAFPFLIIIPRELSLDISDMKGDEADGCKTLPILIGIEKSKIVVVWFLLLAICLSVPVAIYYRYLAISITIVDLLLIWYIYKLRAVEARIDYIKIGRFLWAVMIFGLVAFTISTIF